MELEVLISTINKYNYSFLNDINLKTDAVIGNQCGKKSIDCVKKDGHIFRIINTDDKGLSANRNLTLANSIADICLLADDDITYVDNYKDVVNASFEKYPDADILIFNLFENPIERFVIKKPFVVNNTNYMRFGSVRIAFKRKSIINNDISFDEKFGAGSKYTCGEDTIFLHDCLKKHLKIIALPEYILTLNNTRSSTWFFGYDYNYYYNKGILFGRLYKNKTKAAFFSLLYFIKHINEIFDYGIKNSLFAMFDGISFFIKEENNE